MGSGTESLKENTWGITYDVVLYSLIFYYLLFTKFKDFLLILGQCENFLGYSPFVSFYVLAKILSGGLNASLLLYIYLSLAITYSPTSNGL